MLRLATPQDVPWLAHQMVLLKAQTGWAAYNQPLYNTSTLEAWLYDQLHDVRTVCYLWDPGTPVAFCGASLSSFILPPHMPTVLEWGWGGSPKSAVKCWHAICQWGYDHGAQLAGRSSSQPGDDPFEIRETVIWKVLP